MADGENAWNQTCYQRMAEAITLLQLIDPEPGDPGENELRNSQLGRDNHSMRQLSLQKERDLADNLAFLSVSTHDPCKVTAVCVEEDPSGEGLTVRMTANSGNMEEERKGFECIARTLERIALQGAS